MVDLLPYRFEPEHREVDRSSSADEGDSTGTPSGDDVTEDEDRVDNTETGVVAESVTACQVQQSVSVAKKWTN